MSWKQDSDALVEQTMAFAKSVKGETVKPEIPMALIDEALAPQPPGSARLTPMVWPTSGREEIKQRVANFKAHQARVQREREDYYERTMATTRQIVEGSSLQR